LHFRRRKEDDCGSRRRKTLKYASELHERFLPACAATITGATKLGLLGVMLWAEMHAVGRLPDPSMTKGMFRC
jgi:hypothetical protein